MSNDMNVLTEKVGDVSRAANTALSNASVVMDGAEQTRQRQNHIGQMANNLQNGRYNDEGGRPDALFIKAELESILGRCPTNDMFGAAIAEQHRLVGIVQAEISELYEMVEKMRDLAGATVKF